MAFNIEEFKGVFSSRQGALAKNKFLFVFANPLNLDHPLWKRSQLQKDLAFYCENVNVPGRNVNTSSHRRYGVGWTESNVINGAINQVQATFIADAQGEVLSLFDAWIHYIIGSESWALNDPNMFAVPYRDDIITNADIHIYKDDGTPSKTYELYEVYPVAILDHQLSWSDDNQIMTFTVVFNVFSVRSFEYGPNKVPLEQFTGPAVSNEVVPLPQKSQGTTSSSESLLGRVAGIGGSSSSLGEITGRVSGLLKQPSRQTPPLQYASPNYQTLPKGPVDRSGPKG